MSRTRNIRKTVGFQHEKFSDFLYTNRIKEYELSTKLGFSPTYLSNLLSSKSEIRTAFYKLLMSELGLPDGSFIKQEEPEPETPEEPISTRQLDRIETQLDRLETKIDRLTMIIQSIKNDIDRKH